MTIIIYLIGVLLSSTSWNFLSLAAFRAITGLGIGGEYAAINSAIDELIPARYRGRVDLIVNRSFWLGAAGGSGASERHVLRSGGQRLEPSRGKLEIHPRQSFGFTLIFRSIG